MPAKHESDLTQLESQDYVLDPCPSGSKRAADARAPRGATRSEGIVSADCNAASTGQIGEQYANGWFMDSVRGHARMWHSGGIAGFSSQIDRFPDDHALVIVLTNLDRLHEIPGVALRLDNEALLSR